MLLEVTRLSFSYPAARRPALDGISFDAAPGDVIAVLGPNGAGKTTLLKLLASVLARDAGSILLDGADPWARPLRYRRMLGYLPESCPLYPEMTVSGYLAYRSRLKGERPSRVRRRVAETISACGLERVAWDRIAPLSRGWRKRIGIADALLRRPRLLLLDDPLAGLDEESRRRLADLVSGASARAAVLVTGHEPREMAGWCNRTLRLDEGKGEMQI